MSAATRNPLDLESTLYRRLSAADRADYDRLESIRPRSREIEGQKYALLGLTANPDTEDDEADSPDYTLSEWALSAIDGRTYKRKSGPDIRWAFRLASGNILEVRPRYMTTEAYLEKLRRIIPEMMTHDDKDHDCLRSSGNWQFDGGHDLAIYRAAGDRRPFERGSFDGYVYPVITTGPQWLTDEVTAKLWAIHRDTAHAFEGMPFCGCCRRDLTDEVSTKLGIGPECARRIGIPHGLTLARRVETGRAA